MNMASFQNYDYYQYEDESPFGVFELANAFTTDISRQGILGIFGAFTPVIRNQCNTIHSNNFLSDFPRF